MLLGAAKVINETKDQLNGNVKLIFQPAEEGPAGALHMINEGVLDGVDEIYGIHLWNYQKVGEIGVKDGPILAAADMFEINITGKGGHGATPHGTVDAVIVASHLISSLQTIVSRNTNPLESTVVSIGMINGGYNFNIIADRVSLKGTTRSYTKKNRNLIKTRMKKIILGTEKMFGAKIELDYKDGYPPTVNHKKCTENVIKAISRIIGGKSHTPYLSMGGEDFSYYLEKIPGCFYFVGSSPEDREPLSTPHHCSHFDIDENSLLIGASSFIKIIEDLLINC
jgi:amidohydrolase